jgi:hypothetical protein
VAIVAAVGVIIVKDDNGGECEVEATPSAPQPPPS